MTVFSLTAFFPKYTIVLSPSDISSAQTLPLTTLKGFINWLPICIKAKINLISGHLLPWQAAVFYILNIIYLLNFFSQVLYACLARELKNKNDFYC